MEFIIKNIEDKNEVLEIFNKIEQAVLDTEKKYGYDEDYINLEIDFRNEDYDIIENFYDKVIESGGKDRLISLTKTLIKFGGKLWSDDETPMGLNISTALAKSDPEYIDLFGEFLSTTDADHAVYNDLKLLEVGEATNWDKRTYKILAKLSCDIYDGRFANVSLVEKLKDEKEKEQFFEIIEAELPKHVHGAGEQAKSDAEHALNSIKECLDYVDEHGDFEID